MTLPNIIFREASLPAFMSFVLTSGNIDEVTGLKLMLTAKLFHAMNKVFSTIRGDDDEITSPCFSGKRLYASQVFSLEGGKRVIQALHPHKFTGYLTVLFASRCYALFLKCFRRALQTQSRTCNAGDVEALMTKGTEFVKPVLLSRSQKFGDEHQFYHFKGKGRFPVLVPGALQLGIPMDIATKLTAMFFPAPVQTYSTANIHLVINGTGNPVDARGVRDASGTHRSNCLSLVPCAFRCQAGKATRFSHREATPMLDSTSDNTFFHTACKAEV
jgi:hypothetical protein